MATITVQKSSIQAEMPFTTVVERKVKKRGVWETAIDEGAVSVDEFVEELQRQLREHYDNA